MSSSDGHAGSHAAHNPNLAHHFDTIEKQDYAARLGMWLFLGTEVLLFAGLFLGYTVYRHFYHDAFHHCSRALNIGLGTTNTLILITSSLFVALAYWAVKVGKRNLAILMLLLTIACAFGFLGIFLGPVLLAVGSVALRDWIGRGYAAKEQAQPPRS